LRIKKAIDDADVEKRQPRAYGFEEDGKYVRVEYTQDNGERVSAVYERRRWGTPPAAVLAGFNDWVKKKRPMSVYSTAKATEQHQPEPVRKPRTRKPSPADPRPE
jgi:hypothetical protein